MVAVRAPRVVALLVASSVVACGSGQAETAGTQEGPPTAQEVRHNTLTEAELAAGWELLFDGRTLDGWRPYDAPGAPVGWGVVDGTLARTGPGGDIVTDREFEDFELTVEWRVEEAGNSGIFYRAALGEEWIYHSAPEMQVLDDAGHRDGGDPITSAGANYGLDPAPRGVVRPAGEWNEVRIVVQGAHVEHWLNGTQVVAYELWSEEWEAKVAASKFVEWPAYGRAERGHIGLQDHGDPVWYRNIKIRELR
ncbi:MAG: hypothetical protein AMS19_05570 [Gemmatimonas sp. SG8_23]|nr:MAG: hypothetical protein AMS19_05570 [Gemmatimonas sp. SG8_23]